jgi:hypothetical protein
VGVRNIRFLFERWIWDVVGWLVKILDTQKGIFGTQKGIFGTQKIGKKTECDETKAEHDGIDPVHEFLTHEQRKNAVLEPPSSSGDLEVGPKIGLQVFESRSFTGGSMPPPFSS